MKTHVLYTEGNVHSPEESWSEFVVEIKNKKDFLKFLSEDLEGINPLIIESIAEEDEIVFDGGLKRSWHIKNSNGAVFYQVDISAIN